MKRLLLNYCAKIMFVMVLANVNSACTTAQEPAAPPALTSYNDIVSRDLHNPDLLAFLHKVDGLAPNQELSTGWTFKQLYWAAIYYNPDLAEAKAQFEAVQAAEITAGQSPNPTLSLTPSFDNSTTPDAWLFGVGLSVPIETNGKRDLRLAAAQRQALSAQAAIVGRAWDVRSRVLNATIDLLLAKETIAKTQNLSRVLTQIHDVYAGRANQGQMPTALASQNEILYQQSLLQVQQARTELMLAQTRLAGAIGVPIKALQDIKISESYPNFKQKNVSRQTILLEHPAVLSAFYDYHVAHENLRLELAKQVPDITLGPGYEWNSQQGGKFSLGLSLILPIRNNNAGPVAEARAKREVAAKHFETIQFNAINMIEQASTAYTATTREMQSADKIVSMQQDKQSRLKNMLRQGTAADLPLLYAQTEIANAQIASLGTKAKLLHAEAALEDAMRQPLFGPVWSQNNMSRK